MTKSDGNATLRPGDILGGYQLLMAVGAGGMGRVWAARRNDAPGRAMVALKTALEEMVGDEQFERMLLDEARIAASIVHPNVCAIREVGAERGIPYLVMDWMDAGTLLDLLAACPERRLDVYIAARVFSNVAAGLHAAHELTGPDGNLLNVVHRDVSPQNVLLSSDGHVKVADFGVAKAKGQLHAPTETGQVKGKLSYMAPEQLTTKNFDRRADVFALGCCLYEATTGQRPFHGGDALETMYKLLETECPAPSSLIADYPPALEAVVVKALQKDPEQRYQSADDVRVALESFLAKNGRLVTDRDVSALIRSTLTMTLEAREAALREASATISITDRDRRAIEITQSDAGQAGVTPRAWNTDPPHRRATRYREWGVAAVLVASLIAGVVWVVRQPKAAPATPQPPVSVPASAPVASTAVVTITLRAEPADAMIRIDNGPPLTSPQILVTTPNQQLRTIVVSRDGYEPQTRQLTFDHNQEIVLGLTARQPESTATASLPSGKRTKSTSPAEVTPPTPPPTATASAGDAMALKRKRPKRQIDPSNPFAEP